MDADNRPIVYSPVNVPPWLTVEPAQLTAKPNNHINRQFARYNVTLRVDRSLAPAGRHGADLMFESSDGQDSRLVRISVNAPGPRPTIADPSRVSTAGGDLVTLTMRAPNVDIATEDFLSYSVTFGGEPGTVVASRVIDSSRSHVELDVTTPAHPAGFVEIVVTAPNGRFGVLDQRREFTGEGFAFVDDPIGAVPTGGNWEGSWSETGSPVAGQDVFVQVYELGSPPELRMYIGLSGGPFGSAGANLRGPLADDGSITAGISDTIDGDSRVSLEGTLLERNDGDLAGDLAGVLDGSPITVRFVIGPESASDG